MTPGAAAKHRLVHQQIALSQCTTPGEVVSRLGAMQAQDYPGALWAIGLRLPKSTEADVEQAIAQRAIVRTWPMRGTLHFVAAADIHWMLKFLTPRVIAGAARRREQLELDDKTFVRCEKIFARTLQGGQQLTREEMFASLEQAGIPVDNHRGYHILWRLAQEGLLCFGPRRGRQLTFTLLDEWVPSSTKKDRAEALAELALRYFTSHGPSTLPDFAWWSGLKMSEARAALEAVSSHLIQETIAQKTYWLPPTAPTPSAGRASSGLYLLPGFDEYMLGYQDRSAALPTEHAQKIVPGSNGMFLATIILNGQAVGTWQRTPKPKRVTLTARPFTPLDEKTHRAFTKVSAHYARFLGVTLAET